MYLKIGGIKTKIIFLRKMNETNRVLFVMKNFKFDTNNLVTLKYEGTEKSFVLTYKDAFMIQKKEFIFYVDWDNGALYTINSVLPIADPKIINYLFKANLVKQFTKGLNSFGVKMQITTLIMGVFGGIPVGMALLKYVFAA